MMGVIQRVNSRLCPFPEAGNKVFILNIRDKPGKKRMLPGDEMIQAAPDVLDGVDVQIPHQRHFGFFNIAGIQVRNDAKPGLKIPAGCGYLPAGRCDIAGPGRERFFCWS